jgi:hypothetical protein
MKKSSAFNFVFVFIVSFFLIGCPLEEDGEDLSGTHCYVASALYLLYGDVWPDSGYVDNVFDTYKKDEEGKLIRLKHPDLLVLHKYQDEGARVVILYWNHTANHSRPLEYHEFFDNPIIYAYINLRREDD